MRIHSWAILAAALFYSFSADALAQRTPYSQPPVHVFGPPLPLSPMDQHGYRKRPPRDNCPALEMLNEVALKQSDDGLDLVQVKFNGQDMDFVLDLTAETSLTSPAAAEKANVSVLNYPAGNYVIDAAKHQILKSVRSKFEMSKRKFDEWEMAVSPYLSGPGVLGRDFVEDADLDIDFGARRLRTYSAYHCPGDGVYWKAPIIAKVALAPDVWSDSNYHVQVDLDGQSLWATIDTGAAHSSIRDETAGKLFNLAPAANPHAFGKLSIGDLAIANPLLDVAPGRDSVRQPGGPIRTRFKYPDVVIGMDILRKLHLYFAFQEKMMYVSPASPQEAAVTSASPPAPALQQ